MFETDIGLMNYRHDRCMPGGSKMFEIETGNMALIKKKSLWFIEIFRV